ncbi:MAG: iron-sulfur cluster assembly accessory protein [Thermodesulfobacteriota bacterium]
MNITIKEKADAMLNAKLELNQFLRIGVTAGGCAGLTYNAEIASVMFDDECVVHSVGVIRIVANKETAKYLDGLVVDYSDDLINGGLQFTNASTSNTCGCGQSFSLTGFPEVEGGACHN